jgi:hypothetical protein
VHGPRIFVNPDAAQTIGLALHELGTNASKSTEVPPFARPSMSVSAGPLSSG